MEEFIDRLKLPVKHMPNTSNTGGNNSFDYVLLEDINNAFSISNILDYNKSFLYEGKTYNGIRSLIDSLESKIHNLELENAQMKKKIEAIKIVKDLLK